ncbi:uncharacterized protein LOC128958609 [Oppia nitens]|uniref:uncharacterized protein LOC128958609 n=1 Tax=Oppia nitens TaxID=1686743 RepID=UPI0023DB6D1C|nr:uncharacterized protein LOC128958609 [Oppia nitens]
MSKILLKKSLQLLENDIDLKSINKKTKRQIKLKGKDRQRNVDEKNLLKLSTNKPKKTRETTNNERQKQMKIIKMYKDLHENRVKYDLVKKLLVNKQKIKSGKKQKDHNKSVFTDDDFKEFALNYK